MLYEFNVEIKQLEGKIKWSVLYFPYSPTESFGLKGKIPVSITVDGHKFEHMLLPSKNGHYLVYNEFIKRAVGKKLGESVYVTIEKDNNKREFITPNYIKDYLIDAGVLDLFLVRPDYEKREQVQHIELAKKEETKINRINTLIKQLNERNNK
ncbi:MAG: YdeI/OmpD-associated family protein [Anaerocolumna sp.]